MAPVAAEEFHPPALFRRKLVKVLIYTGTSDLIQNIDHRVGIPVGDAAVILAEAPFVGFGAPDAAVSLEFIDTDGFRKFLDVYKRQFQLLQALCLLTTNTMESKRESSEK